MQTFVCPHLQTTCRPSSGLGSLQSCPVRPSGLTFHRLELEEEQGLPHHHGGRAERHTTRIPCLQHCSVHCCLAFTSVFAVCCPSRFSQPLPQRSRFHLLPQLEPDNCFSKVTHWQTQHILFLSTLTPRTFSMDLSSLDYLSTHVLHWPHDLDR